MVAREPEVSVRAGAGAELECVAHGNPAPSIRWRRLRVDQVSSLLHFTKLNKRSSFNHCSVTWTLTAHPE